MHKNARFNSEHMQKEGARNNDGMRLQVVVASSSCSFLETDNIAFWIEKFIFLGVKLYKALPRILFTIGYSETSADKRCLLNPILRH